MRPDQQQVVKDILNSRMTQIQAHKDDARAKKKLINILGINEYFKDLNYLKIDTENNNNNRWEKKNVGMEWSGFEWCRESLSECVRAFGCYLLVGQHHK